MYISGKKIEIGETVDFLYCDSKKRRFNRRRVIVHAIAEDGQRQSIKEDGSVVFTNTDAPDFIYGQETVKQGDKQTDVCKTFRLERIKSCRRLPA